MIFSDPNKSLEILLDSAATTNQLDFYVSYNRSSNTAINGKTVVGTTNDTTAVTIVPAPDVSVQHYLTFFSVYNADSVDADVIIQVNDGSSVYQILKITLAPGFTLSHTEADWHVTDTEGRIRLYEESGSITDHGLLTGLSDDDHLQYHNDSRGDSRYYTQSLLDGGQLDSRYFTESEHLNVSAGAGDAGKPIILDTGGHVDSTMINDSDIDHTAISNIGTNTHSQIDSHIADVSGNPHAVDKSNVGLSNVVNLDTSDADNISDGLINAIITLTQETNFESAYTHSNVVSGNPHNVTKSDVGLSNVTNDAQVKKLSSSTNNNVPTWNGTTGDSLSDGYGVTTTLGDPGDDSTLATEAAIRTAIAGAGGLSDHGSLSGLLDDDHEQYALLAGRSGGQLLKGGTDAGDDLTLESTNNVTKGDIIISDPLVLTTNTEPGSPTTGNIYSNGSNVYFYTGSTWLNITTPVSLNDSIVGLELSNNSTDPDHDIDIATGSATLFDGSSGYRVFFLNSVLTKQIDVNWTEGNDAGGFPSGLTLSADTHYNFFLLGKDDGTVDAGFDSSSSASNLLADAATYSWYRRIGSVFTDGSSNIRGFTQINNWIYYIVKAVDISDSTLTSSVSETGTVSVPPNQVGIFDTYVLGTDCRRVKIDCGHPDTTLSVSSLASGVGYFDGENIRSRSSHNKIITPVNSSSQLTYEAYVNQGSLDNIQISSIGWIDSRQ